MCGIVGILFFEDENMTKEEKAIRKEAGLFLFTEILSLTETRGKDATGVTALFENGDYVIQKGAFKATDFISRYGDESSDFDNFLNLCREQEEEPRAFIGHCRKSSVGNITDNENNHPIRAGEIVGIHNGTLKNQNKIFKKLGCKRDGTVDSEAIFRLLEHFTKKCKQPFTMEILEETVSRLQGSYSCLAYNANNPFQIAAFRKDRPMEFCLIRNMKMLIITSEQQFFRTALFNYNKSVKLFNSNLPLITKADVLEAMLPHDSVALIDLTQECHANTTLVDIVERKNVTGIKKLWQTDTYTTYGNGYYNRHTGNTRNNTNATTGNTTSNTTGNTTGNTNTNNNKTTPKTSANKDETFKGKVYCKSLQSYVREDLVKEAAKVGSICVNRDTGEIIELEKAVQKIKETKQEIALDDLQDILTAARACKRYKHRYVNNTDFIKDIGATSISSVKSMEPYALSNRIRPKIFEEGFTAGVTYARAQQVKNKGANATAIIATAKKVIDIITLTAELNRMPKETEEAVKLSTHVPDVTVPKQEELAKLLSEGDLKNSPTLKALYKIAGKNK